MNRAGREPAEDVKRRIVAACTETGLEISTARMYLRKHQSDRVILVAASPNDWPFDRPMITILTTVSVSGDWSCDVDIRCSASEADSLMGFWDTPVMRGRNSVPIEHLIDQLRKTIEEREQVVAALRLGVTGPYTFQQTRWENPSDLLRT